MLYLIPFFILIAFFVLNKFRLISHTSGEDSIGSLADLMIVFFILSFSLVTITYMLPHIKENICKSQDKVKYERICEAKVLTK